MAAAGCVAESELESVELASLSDVDAGPGVLFAAPPVCEEVTLVASKRYFPSIWSDANVLLDRTIEFALPQSVPVTEGNSGNHTVTFEFGDPLVSCTYRGTGRVPAPISPADVAAAQEYRFETCGGAASPGTTVSSDWFFLHVVQGGSYIFPGRRDEVTLVIGETGDCCSPSDPPTYYDDADGDGFGDPATATETCTPDAGAVDNGDDCDDADPDVNPDAAEVCNGVDDDCDGTVDDGATDETTWYADADGDGYGDPAATTEACERPAGFVADDGDCDDADPDVNPGAAEVCNGIDDDCDGTADDGAGETTWYADADGDGFGDPATSVSACAPPDGFVDNAADCDDASAAVYPGAPEVVADGVDQDCSGGDTCYLDADGDGYGSGTQIEDDDLVCTNSSRPTSDVDSDCNDAEAAVNPGVPEVCNGNDDDCDGAVDEGAIDADMWYRDADGDGYGDAGTRQVACERPGGFVDNDADCDDGDAGVNPGASESCNGVDDDCDGTVDDDVTTTWYRDADGDGYGDAAVTADTCSRPAGYVGNDDDCDDTDAAVNPGGDEVCNGVDDDCNGVTDDGVVWYRDQDGDGFGNLLETTVACPQPPGYVDNALDCDDTVDSVNPGEAEVCDGLDNDCDGFIDDNAIDAPRWFLDADGDGFGDPDASVFACTQPAGTVINDADCDDTEATTHPGAPELCNGVDDDCDGEVDDGC